jgi:hypothetical protein
MNTQEKFDDIIRSKFSEREIPFDEANWENIKKMTNAAREKKKRRRWLVIFFIGLVCGVGVTAPFLIKNSDFKNNLAENKPKAVETNENKQSKTEQITNEKKGEKNNSSASSENSGEKESADANQTENKSIGKRKTSVSLIQKDETVDNTKNSSATTIAPIKKEKSQFVISASKTEKEQNGKSVSGEEKTDTAISEVIAKEENKTKNETPQGDLASGNKDVNSQIVNPKVEKQGAVKIQEQEIVVSNTNIVTANESPASTKDTSAKKIEENSNATSVDSTNKPGTPIIVAAKDSSQKKNNPWALSLVAGVNFANSAHSPFGGIEITKSVAKHWKIGTGLYYTYFLGRPDETTRRFTSNNYDFGVNNKITVIDINKLHYGIVNIFTEFLINKKNSLVLGTNLFYLFTTSNTITTYNEDNNGVSNVVSKKTYGYSTGLSPYDIGIMGGYRRKLFGKLDAGLYINFGQISVTEKKFVQNTGNENYYPFTFYTNSIQLVLKYNLFKSKI